MSKKEKKKLKKTKKHRLRPEIYDPEKAQSFEGSVILGYFLRLLTVAFAAFSVVFMLCNSFEISKEVNAFAIFMFCLGTTVAVSLIFYGKWKLTLIGFGIIFAYIAVVNLVYGSPLTFFITGIDELFDKIFFVIDKRGFLVYDFVNIPRFGYADSLLKGGTYTLAFVVSLFFTLFSLRKVHLAPFVILGSAVCAVCFIYNISESNWGIALLITALAAMVALARYDKVFVKNQRSKKSRAYSGYVSAMAGILCLAIVFIPALAVKKSFREIDFIQKPLDNIRVIVTTILLGGDLENNKMNTLENEVSTDFEEIKTSGDILFKVKAYSNRPIYLRSWIGDIYDIKKDSWSVLSQESYKELTDLMSKGGGRAFGGDALTYHLYNLQYHYNVDEKNFPKDKGYTSRDYAFTATMVDIQYVGNSGVLYIMPTVYAQPIGLYKYGSSEEEYDEEFNVYSDGIYSSDWINLFKSYRAPAIIPNYKNKNYETVSENDAKYFKLLANFIDKEVPSYQYSISEELIEELDCVKKFMRLLDENGLYDMGIGPLRDYLMLSSYEQREWYNVYVRGVNTYTQFVKDNYLEVPESQAVSKIRGEILDEFERAQTSHAKVMTVIDYLCENYKYSLNPAHDPEFEGSVLDEFLLSKNEGYCVQFASAATVLLRSLGIPARYVQGYTAYDYDREVKHDEDGDRYYEAKVTDKNAHAWVEVYIEGLGWRAYETTPQAYDSIYYQSPVASSPSKPTLPETPNQPEPKPEDPIIPPPPVVEPEEEITDEIVEENTFDTKKFTRFMAVLAVVVVATGAVWIIVRRSDNILDKRKGVFERAVHSSFIDGYDRRMLAVGMADMFYETLAIGRDLPKKGEAPSEFASRVEKLWAEALGGKGRKKKRAMLMTKLPHSTCEMVNIISKLEFGGSISDEELGRLAEYISELQKYEYQSKNIFGKIWYRYITCKL